MKIHRLPILSLWSGLLLGPLLISTSLAQDSYRWNGSRGQDFWDLIDISASRTNWTLNGSNSVNSYPEAGDTAIFPNVGDRNVDLNGNRTVSTVQITSSNAYTIGDNNTSDLLTVSSGNFDVTAGTHTFNGGLSFGTAANSSMDIASGATLTQPGTLSGAANQTIVKDGDGTWVLTGDVTHTGTIQLADGTIQLSPTTQLSALELFDISSGAMLDLNGASVTGGTFDLASGAVLNLNGGSADIDTLNLLSGAVLDLNGDTFDTGTLTGIGQLTLRGGSFSVSETSAFQGQMDVSAGALLPILKSPLILEAAPGA